MKGKTLHIFVRFGGLDLKNQEGYSQDPATFHAPPAPRGFYAMPKIVQEFFLIGSLDKFQPSTLPKEKPAPGGLTPDEIRAYYEEMDNQRDVARSAMRKEFTKARGHLWHHLGEYVKPNEVVDHHGSWVKTTVAEWERAFRKMSLNHRYGLNDEYLRIQNINDARGILGYYSKDHCEVFFDEKV